MRPAVVVIDRHASIVSRASASVRNTCSLRHSSRKLAVERFDESVLNRLAGLDVVPLQSPGGPTQHGATGQLGPVVANHHSVAVRAQLLAGPVRAPRAPRPVKCPPPWPDIRG